MAYYAAQYPYQQNQQYHYQQYQQPIKPTTSSSLPPWRANTQSMSANGRSIRGQTRQGEYNGQNNQSSVDIYALVDSWRSYSTDTTNLQTTTASTASLNAAAPAFQPNLPQKSAFIPYGSLRSVHSYARYPSYRVDKSYRVSNGTAERRIVETNNTAQGQHQNKHKRKPKNKSAPLASVQPTGEFASRYPVRSKRGIADTPLPSIEPSETTSTSTILPIRQVNSRYSRTKSPEAPVATLAYNTMAQKAPVRLTEPRKLLVILDLNGTLLYRVRSAGSVHLRPGIAPFIDYIFENHIVMIYTSATPEKAELMVNSFLHPSHRKKLAGFWARDKLELTALQYRNKVQVYKKLDKIWNDPTIQKSAESGTQWDQSNTILIDDSRLKALSQPFNLLQVSEYTSVADPRKAGKVGTTAYKSAYQTQLDVMKNLENKIEELRYQQDVSRLIRQWQSSESEVAQSDQQPTSTIVNEKKNEALIRTHLPTPESLIDENEGGVSLEIPEEGKHIHRERSGSVSSIDESVFSDLLRGESK